MVCYNPDEHISHMSPTVAPRQECLILAITFPVPGARLFGINNYRAGLAGGRDLGDEIVRRWSGDMDLAVILDIPGSSPPNRRGLRE